MKFKIVLAISSLVLCGCVKQDFNEKATLPVIAEQSESTKTHVMKEIQTPIQLEHQKLFERIKELELMEIENTEKPLNIAGQVNLTMFENEPYLSIDIVLDKPKNVMKNALALVIFDRSLQNYVIADYPYVTNYQGKEITISPEKDPKGFSIGRGLPLQKDLEDKDKFIKVFDQVKILLVYEDMSGNLQREYFITSTGEFKISDELLRQIK